MPRTLSEIADAIEDAARAAKALGAFELAAKLFELAIEQRDRLASLRSANQSGNTSDMVTAERVRVSKGRKKRDELVVAANTHNYTLRSLAEKLEAEGFRVSHSLLSQARADAKGQAKRSISGALAKRIEELTGFAASKKNWPGLRS